MNARMIQIAYLLGISLLLTSILYFFASNWPHFERLTKITLAILLLLLFYTVHLLLERWVTWQPFLSNWALIAASIVFGISVALVGQTYNSHADSYELFLIWLIPVLILAVMTRYVPFYVLGYILSQLAIGLFISPTGYIAPWNDEILLLLLLGMIVFNGLLFIITYRGLIKSHALLYMSGVMFHIIFFYTAVIEKLPFHFGLNIIYLFILVGSIYYWSKHRLHKGLLTVTSVFAASYFFFRVMSWVLNHFGELVLYVLLFLAIGLAFLGVMITGFLNKQKLNRYATSILTLSITIITTLFAIIAITGIFFLLFPGATTGSFYFFAVIILIIPGLFVKMKPQFRYSLLGTGFLLAFIAGMATNHILYPVILIIPLVAGIYIIQQNGVKVMTYLLTNIVIGYILIDLFSFHTAIFTLFLLNTVYYLLFIKERAVNFAAFLVGSLCFLGLTFVDTTPILQFLYNGVFLTGVPLMIFVLYKNKEKVEWTTMLVLWFVFLGATYYEYFWTLIHKSIAALVLGLIFISVAYLFDRPNKTTAPTGSVVTYKKSLLIVVIILQLGFVSFQAYTSEKLLQEGEEVKLELAPVDPRSMLQGDYLALNYDINRIKEVTGTGNVKIVLRKENNVYRYAGYYKRNNEWNKDYQKRPDDVIMNGKIQGDRQIRYGIETYFVPEGTGHDLENEVEYALIRVSKSGDAIVDHLE